MKPFTFFQSYTKDQRRGIVALFILIILLQGGYYLIMSIDLDTKEEDLAQKKEWLALQSRIDELKAQNAVQKHELFPFNPNFISDYKGYTLGMTTAQIDKLHAFRKNGRFVNSADDFKKVTGVSDSLLNKISPYFKFPEWVQKKKQQQYADAGATKANYSIETKSKPEFSGKAQKVVVTDINNAVEEDLDKVYGIGPAYAKQILRRRAQLGGFVSMDQMDDFKDFSPEAVKGLKKTFAVLHTPAVDKISINSASLNQLTYFPYFNRSLAKGIITRRSMKGKISKIEELLDINDFPVDKVKIIALYLDFQ